MTKITDILPIDAPLSNEQKSFIDSYFEQKRDILGDTYSGVSDCIVLFSSQTGNAESVAHDIGGKLNAPIMDMGDVDSDAFQKFKQVVIITSTYGDGEHPDNGQILWDTIGDIQGLDSMQYAILGLGDTAYDLFCQSAIEWDTILEKAGAKRILDTVKLDVDYEEEAEAWGDKLIPIFGSKNDKLKNIVVLFSSQTGNAESVANDIASIFGVDATDMGDVDLDVFKSYENIIIITSTYGDGEHPDNGQILWDTIGDIQDLDGMQYAILGLGDTAYDLFCQSAIEWDALLENAGANRVQETAKLDIDYEDSAKAWASTLIKNFGDIGTIISSPTIVENKVQPRKSIYTKSNPFMGTMITNRTLSSENSSKQVCHFEFSIPDPDMAYEAGDALGIIPLNSDTLIDNIITANGFKENTVIDGKSIRNILSTQEIRNPTKDFVSIIAEKSGDANLTNLLKNNNAYSDFIYGREIIDFLNDYNISFTLDEFLSVTKPLAPRLYSISSSPNAHKDEVHLTVAAVRYDFNNRPCEGVASCFMADNILEGQKVAMFIHPNRNFSVPENDTLPMIMIGPGTGIAPFRGFLEERISRGATGNNWLFFGDRTWENDYLYKNQLEAWEKDAKLRLSLAWSRQKGIDKTYVQDKMLEDGRDLFEALEAGGYFFVCGDASRMAKDVEATLLEIIATFGAMSVEKATLYLNTMKKEKRYVRDVY